MIDSEKELNSLARIVSAVFTPFIIPFVGFLVLFLFTYLRLMPPAYKLIVLGMVASFTILLPAVIIYLFRRLNRLPPDGFNAHRKLRYVPLLLTMVAYVCLLLLMVRMNLPWYLTSIIGASLLMMAICTVANRWCRLSEHTMGLGAIIGGLVSFSALFDYNPVTWLCLFIILAGIIGSSRILLGRNTLSEVMGGFAVGLGCSMLVLHPLCNLFFRLLLL